MQILALFQNLSFLPRFLLVCCALKMLPVMPGVTVNSSLSSIAIVGAAFTFFEIAITAVSMPVLNSVVDSLVPLVTGDKTTKQNNLAEMIRLPYPLTLLLFFGRRVLAGSVFMVIASSLIPNLIKAEGIVALLLSGTVLAGAF